MRGRWGIALAAFGLLAGGRAEANFIIGVTNTGQTSSTSPPGQPGGTLSFTMGTNSTGPGGVPVGATPTDYELSTYGNVSPSVTPGGGGGFVNASINYILVVTIGQVTAGDLGTIEIGGSGNGGFDSTFNTDPFINDSLAQLTVNGVAVPFTGFVDTFNDTFAQFAFARGDGTFLNVRLYDPNPDFDGFNPTPGVAAELTITPRTPLPDYTLVPGVPAAVPVPAPASVVLLALGASAGGAGGLLGRLRRRPAVGAA